MIRRPARRIALLASVLLACATGFVATAPSAQAAVTTQTPVMGPNLLNATELAAWYDRHNGSNIPQIPGIASVRALAQVFIDQGRAEGVRGDIAFVQSQLETGWLSFRNSQITPAAYNYAGIFAFNGRPGLPHVTPCVDPQAPPNRCMGSPAHGVKMQMQLLRSYADPSVASGTGRLLNAPSDRRGLAPLWEYFGGSNCPCNKLIWASADDYGLRIIEMYSQALAEAGKAGACVPYAPPTAGAKSGTGYWQVSTDKVVRAFGALRNHGDPRSKRLAAPLVGAEAISTGDGYWLLGRDGGIFSYGKAKFYGSTGAKKLNQPVNGMERTVSNGGYWLVADDGGIFSFGNAKYYGSTGGRRLNAPVLGMERTFTGKGYWLFARDGGVFSFGDAEYHGSLGANPPSSPIVQMVRTKTDKGYWMLTRDGRVFKFGDAKKYGDVSKCKNYGGAARMLMTPTGKGYWITTNSGVIVAFGDAKNLGFPETIGGTPIALVRGNA